MSPRILLILLLFPFYLCKAQLTGNINNYTEVTAISSNTITVASNTAFAIGDKVFVIQMKGATIDLTNTSSYGTISPVNNAGNYAIGTILLKPGTTSIVLTSTLSAAFTPGGTNRVQLVSVRTVTTGATVTGNIIPTAWNGTVGGVVVLEVAGSLTINAGCRIDASGCGFMGGAVSGISNGSAWCNFSDFRSPNVVAACYTGIYAQKGEGVAEDAGNNYARGPLGTGGGGAGEHNGGGGGGGNIARGGAGGRQLTDCPIRRNGTGINCNTPVGGAVQSNTCNPAVVSSTSDVMVGGLGGYSLTAGSLSNKIFFGGGGGGGQQNGAGGSNGGNGGGIIVISASTIVNNSGSANAIRANGNAAAATTGNEGAGGGGAGGSVILETNSFVNAITISATGGNGGNAVTSNVTCRGPGGGGGGGLIWISGLTTSPVNLTTNILSGSSGSVVCSAPGTCGGVPPATTSLTCYGNTAMCAETPPSNGTVQANLILPLPVTIVDFKTVCYSNYTEVLWTTAEEKNISHYVLQKSANSLDWNDLTQINSSPFSTGWSNYSFNDQTVNNSDVVYYRIKTIERDGRQLLSSTISGRCKANSSYEYKVKYDDGLNLSFTKLPNKVSIYDMQGRFIQEVNLNSVYDYSVNTSLFSQGIYLVVADYGTQTVAKKVLINYN